MTADSTSNSQAQGIPQARSVERKSARRQQVKQAPKRMARKFVQLPQRINPGITVLTAVLVIFLAFSIAQPLRNYFEQRTELSQLNAKIESQEQKKADLIEDLNRYDNENFVKEQARARLGLIEPGESAFRIISPKIKAGGEVTSEEDHVPGRDDPQSPGPWYSQLWDSISVPEEESVTNTDDEDTDSLKLPTVPES